MATSTTTPASAADAQPSKRRARRRRATRRQPRQCGWSPGSSSASSASCGSSRSIGTFDHLVPHRATTPTPRGWWTVFVHPRRCHLTCRTTTTLIVNAQPRPGVHQQPRDRAAGDVHPDPDRRRSRPTRSRSWSSGAASSCSSSIVSLLVVPNYVAFVPILKIYGNFGLDGTFPAVWLAHIGFGMSLAIYILRNYMATLPKHGDRVGQDRRCQPLPDLLPADPADVGARRWRRSRSSSSCGSGTTCWSPWSSSGRAVTTTDHRGLPRSCSGSRARAGTWSPPAASSP